MTIKTQKQRQKEIKMNDTQHASEHPAIQMNCCLKNKRPSERCVQMSNKRKENRNDNIVVING